MTNESPYRETIFTETEQTEIEKLRSENEALKIELTACKARQKWEYRIIEIERAIGKKELDLIGQEGWELSTIMQREDRKTFFIFKCPCG